ncbi:hypothetical protein D3C78_802450 [compost metagenome]
MPVFAGPLRDAGQALQIQGGSLGIQRCPIGRLPAGIGHLIAELQLAGPGCAEHHGDAARIADAAAQLAEIALQHVDLLGQLALLHRQALNLGQGGARPLAYGVDHAGQGLGIRGQPLPLRRHAGFAAEALEIALDQLGCRNLGIQRGLLVLQGEDPCVQLRLGGVERSGAGGVLGDDLPHAHVRTGLSAQGLHVEARRQSGEHHLGHARRHLGGTHHRGAARVQHHGSDRRRHLGQDTGAERGGEQQGNGRFQTHGGTPPMSDDKGRKRCSQHREGVAGVAPIVPVPAARGYARRAELSMHQVAACARASPALRL